MNLPAFHPADARCADADPELFFPSKGGGHAVKQVRDAKRLCSGCPVRTDCLEYALEATDLDGQYIEGIWGGLTTRERMTLRRERGITTKADHLLAA